MDIILLHHPVLAFVEVRTKTNLHFGHPFETINHTKRLKMAKVAMQYLMNHRVKHDGLRFDIVSVLLQEGQEAEVEWLQDAFRLGDDAFDC